MSRSGQTTALSLPDGGTLEVPLPGGKGRFLIKAPSLLAASDGTSRLPLILVGIAIGVTVGVTATVYYLNRR